MADPTLFYPEEGLAELIYAGDPPAPIVQLGEYLDLSNWGMLYPVHDMAGDCVAFLSIETGHMRVYLQARRSWSMDLVTTTLDLAVTEIRPDAILEAIVELLYELGLGLVFALCPSAPNNGAT